MSSEDTSVGEPITFTVKSNNDTKYTVTISPTASITELKTKLSEMADVPVERQRLIYSGRVMKNEETLDTYKVKSGNTVHMVKSAASAAPQQGTSATPSGLPSMSAGTAPNDPLAGLTGARYAGHVPLPGAQMFGADGGMGAPPNPAQLSEAMQNPMVRSQVNEMLSNPQMLDYIINSNPMLQSIPGARDFMQSPLFRQMITDPEIFRNLGAMGGAPGAPQAAFPAPGATDTTPAGAESAQGQQQAGAEAGAGAGAAGAQPGQNPFAALFGQGGPGAAAGAGAAQNPLFNPALMASLMGGAGAGAAAGAEGASPGAGAPGVPNLAAMQQMLAAMEGQGQGGANPFAGLGGLGGLGSLGGGVPPAPADNRPPEERYADQLRQLNDMGFFDFDANVAALRRSGGSVQGAVNQLLGG